MEQHLKPLRGKNYAAAPETKTYPEPTEQEQSRNVSTIVVRARVNGTLKRRIKP